MTSPIPRLAYPLLLATLLLCVASVSAQEYAGSEMCESCHEEVAEAFRHTAHALAAGWSLEEGCESCHGPGTAHIEAGGDLEKILRFATLKPREASDQCLSCHQRMESQFQYKHGLHSMNDVACTDCHNPHSSAVNLLRKPGARLCGSCHHDKIAQFELPRAHPLAEADKGCVNCHDPHGPRSRRTLGGFGPQVCGQCHFEKVGPFLYPHDVMNIDGCQACHEVHGSPNRHLLKHARAINLCYQCHTANQTPGFHSAEEFQTEKCTACHTAIHGSNTNPFFLEE